MRLRGRALKGRRVCKQVAFCASMEIGVGVKWSEQSKSEEGRVFSFLT